MSLLGARPLVAQKQLFGGAVALVQQQRNMATLKEIQLRLRSISNIAKITKSMKMIASTKMTRAQRGMETARTYGKTDKALYQHLDLPETSLTDEGKAILVAVSSDRGMCGSIHSSVAKYIRRTYESKQAVYAVIGDKVRGQLSRGGTRDAMAVSFSQVGKNGPTFLEASMVAERVLETVPPEAEQFKVIYNQFKSVVAFDTIAVDVVRANQVGEAPGFMQYETNEDDDSLLKNMEEFHLANTLFWALSEGHAAEMAARRNAMESATKNAGEMITKLTITYNRSRQAAITNELVDIITGASAL